MILTFNISLMALLGFAVRSNHALILLISSLFLMAGALGDALASLTWGALSANTVILEA